MDIRAADTVGLDADQYFAVSRLGYGFLFQYQLVSGVQI
jgi:hypothetical protein